MEGEDDIEGKQAQRLSLSRVLYGKRSARRIFEFAPPVLSSVNVKHLKRSGGTLLSQIWLINQF